MLLVSLLGQRMDGGALGIKCRWKARHRPRRRSGRRSPTKPGDGKSGIHSITAPAARPRLNTCSAIAQDGSVNVDQVFDREFVEEALTVRKDGTGLAIRRIRTSVCLASTDGHFKDRLRNEVMDLRETKISGAEVHENRRHRESTRWFVVHTVDSGYPVKWACIHFNLVRGADGLGSLAVISCGKSWHGHRFPWCQPTIEGFTGMTDGKSANGLCAGSWAQFHHLNSVFTLLTSARKPIKRARPSRPTPG